ncbi:MAG TPA: hypothetical protein VNU71_12115 [Burkholderiaceae bacterium]|nr:hypothetical protein [Burkholderiaceae bacterium]
MSPIQRSRLLIGIVGASAVAIAALTIAAAVADPRVMAAGAVAPGPTDIALTLAGPGGAAFAPSHAPERDPSVPVATEVFAHAASAAEADCPSF